MKQLLIKLNACNEAMEWAGDKTWEEIYRTCHRGDWLLWLFKQTNPNDLRLLTLAKGHCANTVRHLMKDERSIKAVDAAIAYGEGRIDIEELNNAATTADAYAAADAAAYAAYATDAYADAYAAAAAAYATDRGRTQRCGRLLGKNRDVYRIGRPVPGPLRNLRRIERCPTK